MPGAHRHRQVFGVGPDDAFQSGQVQHQPAMRGDRATVAGGRLAARHQRNALGNRVAHQLDDLVLGLGLGHAVGQAGPGEQTECSGQDARVMRVDAALARIEAGPIGADDAVR